MKRSNRILSALFLLLFVPAIALAGDAISSGEVTSDSAVYAGSCVITGVTVITNGASDATVVLYDNATTGSGSVRAEIKVAAADFYGGRNFASPSTCYNGIYADLTGDGASCIVELQPR